MLIYDIKWINQIKSRVCDLIYEIEPYLRPLLNE